MQIEAVQNQIAKPSKGTDAVPCRLIVTRHRDSQVLLVNAGGHYRLPHLEIPRWQRPAPHLIAELLRNWSVAAICRFSVEGLDAEGGRPEQGEQRYYVLEALCPDGTLARDLLWVPIAEIDSPGVEDSDRILAGITQARTDNADDPSHRFARSGWFDEVTTWVESRLEAHALRLTGPWQQLNMGPDFSLIRYETNRAPVWFKAVGKPNCREYAITARLQELHSAHLPLIIATHSQWHGWLMLDGGGQSLDETWELNQWRMAAHSLAELQIESMTHIHALLGAGCEDLRLPHLHSLIDPFFVGVARLMELQPAAPPRILDANDLTFIKDRLIYALEKLDMLGIPCALGNTDMNPGNILVRGDRVVFIDWMQGNIGHPLLTFEYLTGLLRRLRPDLRDWIAPMRESYRQPWKYICAEDRIERAFELVPLIAVFAFAVAIPGWNQEVDSMSPALAKLMRSLARTMFSEAQRLQPCGAS